MSVIFLLFIVGSFVAFQIKLHYGRKRFNAFINEHITGIAVADRLLRELQSKLGEEEIDNKIAKVLLEEKIKTFGASIETMVHRVFKKACALDTVGGRQTERFQVLSSMLYTLTRQWALELRFPEDDVDKYLRQHVREGYEILRLQNEVDKEWPETQQIIERLKGSAFKHSTEEAPPRHQHDIGR